MQSANCISFGVEGSDLHIGETILPIPEGEDDKFVFLMAIALVCTEAIDCGVIDQDGEGVRAYDFFDK